MRKEAKKKRFWNREELFQSQRNQWEEYIPEEIQLEDKNWITDPRLKAYIRKLACWYHRWLMEEIGDG